MKNPWIAAIGNFFFMGLGTLYIGKRRALGLGLTIGALVLSWLEFQVKAAAPSLYPIMFGTVFFMIAAAGYLQAGLAGA